jgi:hypothetical protein
MVHCAIPLLRHDKLGVTRRVEEHSKTRSLRTLHAMPLQSILIKPIYKVDLKAVDYTIELPFHKIMHLLRIMYWIPLSWRDSIVAYCQVQDANNHRMLLKFQTLQPPSIATQFTPLFSPHDLLKILETLRPYPTILGLIVAFAKQESLCPDYWYEIGDRITKGIEKELMASQFEDVPRSMDYEGLFSDDPSIPLRPGWYSPRLYRQWSLGLAAFIRKRTRNCRTIIPKYNKKKNIGYAAQDELGLMSHKKTLHGRSMTTFDLESYYHEIGNTIEGPNEVRYSWKSFQTKPRVYYAYGGTAYVDIYR